MSTQPLLGQYQQQPGYQQQQPPGYQQPPPGQAPPGPQQGAYGTTGPGAAMPQVPTTFKGDVPNEDVHENAGTQGPPQASAPPIAAMDQVGGYEGVGYQDAFISPPSYDQAAAIPDPHSRPQSETNIPTISEAEARDALMTEVSSHVCYGKGAARDLVFSHITPSSAFHYQLETFTEGRKTAWAYEPYNGQMIDGPQNGPAPAPWSIPIQPSQYFSDHTKNAEVPHTASVKSCHNCHGCGHNRCWRCMGRGRVVCANCDGSGRVLRPVVHHDHHHGHHGHHGHHDHHHHHTHVDMEREFCMQCNGTGRKRCWTCSGHGELTCSLCAGRGQLKCFIRLTITWRTVKGDHVVERTALPDHLIRGAQGRQAFKEEQPRVAPVVNFPDPAVNSASHELVQAHANSFTNERILMQRHWIRIVPVSEVECTWKGKNFTYWVYGYNNLVFAPDYPQKCCCGCTLL